MELFVNALNPSAAWIFWLLAIPWRHARWLFKIT